MKRTKNNYIMLPPKEYKECSDGLRRMGIEEQEDIDAVLDYIQSLASIAIEAVANKKNQNRHP